MGSSKAGGKVRVTKYFMGLHYGICWGKVDRIEEIEIGGKWIADSGAGVNLVRRIDKPGLFGGVKKEGGISGMFWYLLGGPTQHMPVPLKAKYRGSDDDTLAGAITSLVGQFFGDRFGFDSNGNIVELDPESAVAALLDEKPVPAFRDLCSVVLTEDMRFAGEVAADVAKFGPILGTYAAPEKKGCYIGANNPFVKAPRFRVQRASSGWQNGLATIAWTSGSRTFKDSNPIHVIREIQTDQGFGIGMATSLIDDAGYTEAAQTLFDENFGISFIWKDGMAADALIATLLDVIDAVQYTDLRTGKMALRLNRKDYDESTLTTLDETNCEINLCSRRDLSDTVNEIALVYTKPRVEKKRSVTLQALGNIEAQNGTVKSAKRDYFPIRRPLIANRVAARELTAGSAALLTGSLTISPGLYFECVPGAVFKLNFPSRGLFDVIIRLGDTTPDNKGGIEAQFSEDIYAQNSAREGEAPEELGEDLAQLPTRPAHQDTFTLPHVILRQMGLVGSSGTDSAYLGALAASEQSDAYGFELVDATASYRRLGDISLAGYATLAADLPIEATSDIPNVASAVGINTAAEGRFWLIGDGDMDDREVAQVIDTIEGVVLSRGLLDTVPKAWPAGATVWQIPDNLAVYDPTERLPNEYTSVRMLTKTSLDTLAPGDTFGSTLRLSNRANLPLRPANVRIGGVAFTTADNPVTAAAGDDIGISWANRNRLLEDALVFEWGETSNTPETGQTTEVIVRGADTTYSRGYRGLVGDSFSLSTQGLNSGLYEVYVGSERDGESSLQSFVHYLQIS